MMVFKLLRALSCQRRGIAARAQLSPSMGGALAMVFEIGLTATQTRGRWRKNFRCLPAALNGRGSRLAGCRIRLAYIGISRRAVGPIGIWCAPPDAARVGRCIWNAAPLWQLEGETVAGGL